MKKQVLYIHGGESFLQHQDFIERLKTVALWHMETKDEGYKKWTSNFAAELGENYEVFMPPMPNKQNARYEEWSIWFERHFPYLHDGAILIGGSLGAMFLAKYLSQNSLPFRPGAVFLLAGAYEIPGFSDSSCGDFLIQPEEVSISQTDKVIIMHSKDDFVVPLEHAEALSQTLPEAELVIFDDKNHFLIPEFPELVEKIKSI